MKKVLFLTLSFAICTTVFAQNSNTESDSLFKAFLEKSKGIKFEKTPTIQKDTSKPTPLRDTSQKVVQPTKAIKATPSKTDSVKPVKPITTNVYDSRTTTIKKDTISKPASLRDTSQKVVQPNKTTKATPFKTDSVKPVKPITTNVYDNGTTTTKKDTISKPASLRDTSQKIVQPNKAIKATPSKTDSAKLVKPVPKNVFDSSTTTIKKDTFSKPNPTAKPDAKPGLHKFKDTTTTYALEAERKGSVVKLYLKMDNIEQYEEVILVRSQAELGNFTDVRHIQIIKGANKFEYVETEDRYPLPTKLGAAYKIRAVTKDGAIRMFPAITLDPGYK